MMRPRLSKEEQRQVDRATAETERRVETLDALAAMEKRALAAEATIAQVRELRSNSLGHASPLLKDMLDAILAAAPSAALDAHDAQVKAEALEEAAAGIDVYSFEGKTVMSRNEIRKELRARAAEIREAAQ